MPLPDAHIDVSHDRSATGLYEQVAQRLRSRCLLLDVDWVFELAAARLVAIRATANSTTDVALLIKCVDLAIDDALQRDWDAERRGERPTDEERERYRFWTDVFQIELSAARRAAVAFNTLDVYTRQVFFALIIEDRAIEACIETGLGDKETLGRTVRWVLRVLMDAHAVQPPGSR